MELSILSIITSSAFTLTIKVLKVKN